MRLFLFAIGGTGARVVRSLTMMLASGIEGLDSSIEIVPIIIDFDLSNGDKTRALMALESYSCIHRILYPDIGEGSIYDDHFFMTRITPLANAGIANAVQGGKTFEFNFGPEGHALKFADYLKLNQMDTNENLRITKDLLQVLYDDSDEVEKTTELNLDLAKGFKGNPNIGSVVFHDLKNRPEFQLFAGTFNAGAGDRIFIISSIFGGTGSAGFPEIVNAIRMSTLATLIPAIIGASIILPYFDLQPFNPKNGDTGAIDASSFNAKTRAALSYYSTQNGINSKVNAIYYVGDENHDAYAYNEGEDRQKNEAHVVEFVAASSIIDFLKRNISVDQHYAYEFCIKDGKVNKSIKDDKVNESIQLPDFFDNTHSLFLNDLSSFAIAMKYYRDVVCGDRNKVADSTAYYKAERFNLTNKLGRGVYQELDNFLAAKDNNDWGFYIWLDELLKHAHKLSLYKMKSDQDLKTILPYKEIKVAWGTNPIKDDTLSGEINNASRNLPVYGDKEFLKVLRTVAKEKYQNVR